MRVLLHNELDSTGVESAVEKAISRLQEGDFRAAGVKKMSGGSFYRAKLSAADRLLFQIGRVGDQSVLLVLEVIRHHRYEASRFLNGAKVDETKLKPIESASDFPSASTVPLRYVHPEKQRFHLLDKVLSFDDEQDAILGMRPPLIVVGSAGSGKTALVLEKLKQLRGDVLYTTLSPYLTQNARDLYYSHHYQNEAQDVAFMSFRELLESLDVPQGREVTFRLFMKWFERLRATTPVKDGHKLFEEFNGVLTGGTVDREFLSREEYLALGVRQSIFTEELRPDAYGLFEKYLRHLESHPLFDLNMEAYRRLPLCKPSYDFIVVDEIQDLTNTQLTLILRQLRKWDRFILCGDSNQIVHPNFFSWSGLKSMFYEKHKERSGRTKTIERVLANNYRNYRQVTALANLLLQIKNARFGSIDRESNYLVKSVSSKTGTVELLPAKDNVLKKINSQTSRSMHTAVLVPRNEDKAEAARHFKTPLLFSVQEAKGLEYANIVLYNFVTTSRKEFNTIVEGVAPEDLTGELTYARAKDKRDKSLEEYKFFINSLYVAMTRAVENLSIVEKNTTHRLYDLLNLATVSEDTRLKQDESTIDDWKDEANRLAAQGKEEQAEAIRRDILKTEKVEWDILAPDTLAPLKEAALDPESYNKKSKQLLFEYAMVYHCQHYLEPLAALNFKRASEPQKHALTIFRTHTQDYLPGARKTLRKKLDRYGVDFRNPFNQTPLMLASRLGDVQLVDELLRAGADRNALDNWGQNALQIALGESYLEGSPLIHHIGELYPMLAPPALKLRIYNKLVKIDSHLMEFFLLQSMIALFPRILRYKTKQQWLYASQKPSFESGDFFFAVGNFPEYVLPARRKKRAYISSVLSKNELYRDAPYNRRIFLRTEQGQYILNPIMDISINDEWVNIYDMLGLRADAEDGLAMAEKFHAYVGEARPSLENSLPPPPFHLYFSNFGNLKDYF